MVLNMRQILCFAILSGSGQPAVSIQFFEWESLLPSQLPGSLQ